MNRISPAERRRRREQIAREAHANTEQLLQAAHGRWCRGSQHSRCDNQTCLCTCHDVPSVTLYPHCCRHCGRDVTYVTGTMMPESIWVHVGHSDHPAAPVKKMVTH